MRWLVLTKQIDATAFVITVMGPHPVGEIAIGAGFIATLGRHVEKHIDAEQFFAAAREYRIGQEDLAVIIALENAVPRQIFHRQAAGLEVVLRRALRQLCGRKGHMEVVIEIAALR